MSIDNNEKPKSIQVEYQQKVIDFFSNISLKKATLFALIFAVIELLLRLELIFDYGSILGLLYVLSQASIVLFFLVLYLKQKGDS